jgi:hypothetical protein
MEASTLELVEGRQRPPLIGSVVPGQRGSRWRRRSGALPGGRGDSGGAVHLCT